MPILWGLFFGLLMMLLALAGPLYMMNVFDRVLGSRNITTLLVLTAVLALALIVHAMLDSARADILRRASVAFDQKVSPVVFDALQHTIAARPGDRSVPNLQDLESIRTFVSGGVMSTLLDVPWLPILLAFCFIMHPLFGVLVLGVAGLVALLTWATDRSSAEALSEAGKANGLAGQRAVSTFRNFEAVQGMGMRGALRMVWSQLHGTALAWAVLAERRSAVFRILSRFVREFGGSLATGLTAYLVVQGQLSAGLLLIATIIVGKATAPLQGLITNWSQISRARTSWHRLNKLLRETPNSQAKMAQPRPKGQISISQLAVAPPGKGVESLIVRGVDFAVSAGSVLAVIGPSGCGKSTLLRAMLGVWRPLIGEIRYDGSSLADWRPEDFGAAIGYLPQDVELLPGTIEQNIARFSQASHETVILAAERAGAHDMIQSLPGGYNFEVGEYGSGLSGGQRQRIGLARALYNEPAILFLDEPNASLDAVGEERLMEMIQEARRMGVTVVFVTHKVSLVSTADYVLVLGQGTMRDFGPRDEIVKRLSKPRLVPLRAEA
ncbi:MAG: type I secretion system permease/ATPase [Bosea sp. (in: a-proteobacteria)]